MKGLRLVWKVVQQFGRTRTTITIPKQVRVQRSQGQRVLHIFATNGQPKRALHYANFMQYSTDDELQKSSGQTLRSAEHRDVKMDEWPRIVSSDSVALAAQLFLLELMELGRAGPAVG